MWGSGQNSANLIVNYRVKYQSLRPTGQTRHNKTRQGTIHKQDMNMESGVGKEQDLMRAQGWGVYIHRTLYHCSCRQLNNKEKEDWVWNA